MTDVKTDTTIINARATCTECKWDDIGGKAPGLAVLHTKETGHTVTLNTNSFTTVKAPGQKDQPA